MASLLATEAQVVADGGLAVDLAGPVGIGAVVLGVAGILFGIVRQRRRTPASGTASGTPAGSPRTEAELPAATAETTRIPPVTVPRRAQGAGRPHQERPSQRQARAR